MQSQHGPAQLINQKAKQQQYQKQSQNIVVLSLIDPARQLMCGNWRFNSVYVQNLQSLPHAMQFSDQLYPLAILAPMTELSKEQYQKKIYQKNMQLKINPFQTKNYFKTHSFYLKPNTDPLKRKIKVQKTPKQQQLVFDSNFESGNLFKALKVSVDEHQYHLSMQNDINTYGCTQWFFFKALNKQCNRSTFFINNFYKSKSLYLKGMKILIFSKKKSINQNTGWIRGGQDIAYYPNRISEFCNSNTIKNYYTLKFTYYFEYEEDQVYFAYNYPYTYSKLNLFIDQCISASHKYISNRTLCTTVAENKVSLLTITNPQISKSQKKCIFLTSRVHPGETVSSLIMQGLIQYLLDQTSQIASKLRDCFIFKLVPMLNPDGVIHGNYRTNIAGIDLNRIWQQPDKVLSPQIYELKNYIIQFNKQCEVIMVCDIHGHSAKKSVFVYGCNNNIQSFNKNRLRRRTLKNMNQDPKLFPFMVSNVNQNFNFKFCNFSVEKSKSGTARVQLWKQLKIPNIFTLQASFCSAQTSDYHFRPQDYKNIGISFCNTLYDYFLTPPKKQQMKKKLIKHQQTIQLFSSLQSTGKQEESNSDSQSENDLYDAELRKKLIDSKITEIPKRSLLFQETKHNPQKKSVRKVNRRLITQACQRKIKTESSENGEQKIFNNGPKRNGLLSNFPMKKITLQADIKTRSSKKAYISEFNYNDSNNWRVITQKSFLHRIEHSYRGKSSLYRIKRKGYLQTSIDPQRKNSAYRLRHHHP